MDLDERQSLMRMAAFGQVLRLLEIHDQLTATDLAAGFTFEGERVPLVNPQRGIFKPQQMLHLLSIKTVFPKPGAKVWYDDQRHVHRQIYVCVRPTRLDDGGNSRCRLGCGTIS